MGFNMPVDKRPIKINKVLLRWEIYGEEDTRSHDERNRKKTIIPLKYMHVCNTVDVEIFGWYKISAISVILDMAEN